MCDPVSATLAFTALAGGAQAYSQHQQGKAEAKVATQNARLANQQADDRTRLGMIEEQRVRNQTRQAMGTQNAALAANGVELGSGSAGEILSQTAGMGEQDAYLARANALREAWGFKVDANNYYNSRRMIKSGAKGAIAGTVLSTGAQAFGAYGAMGGSGTGAMSRTNFGARNAGFGGAP